MEQVRLRYHRTSTVKKITFSKEDSWDVVKAKIASAYGITSSIENASIVMSDAELDIGSMFPTLGSYLSIHSSGIGRVVFGLCLPYSMSDGESSTSSSRGGVKIRNNPERARDRSRGDSSPLSDSSKRDEGALRARTLECYETIDVSSGSMSSDTDKDLPQVSFRDSNTAVNMSIGQYLLNYSATELRQGTKGFSDECLIGSGAFGKVYAAHLRHTDVAVKIFMEGAGVTQDSIFEEITFLAKYRHPHIVQVLGVCEELNAMIMERLQGSLYQHLHQMCDLEFIGTRIRILHETAQGLAYLHCSGPEPDCKPLIHLDVKSSNILLDHCLRAKVADFGLAKMMPMLPPDKSYCRVESFRGSRAYVADEYYDGQFGPKLDVFSFGVVVVEAYTGQKAYVVQREPKRLVDLIRDALYDIDEFISLRDKNIRNDVVPDAEVHQLAKITLAARHKRASMAEVLNMIEDIRKKYNLY